MNIEEVREYCIAKEDATEGFPFNDTALVFKVGKIFAILDLSEDKRGISLKCTPDRAIELREEFSAITPGYHLNKTHWNTIALEGTVPGDLIRELIDLSYDLVKGT